MDEILLTHEELLVESQKEHERFDELQARGEQLRWGDWWYAWLLRAQARKVAGWSEGECKHDSKRIRRCCDLCWRDVRAALGVSND